LLTLQNRLSNIDSHPVIASANLAGRSNLGNENGLTNLPIDGRENRGYTIIIQQSGAIRG